MESYFSRMCRKKYCAAIGQTPLTNNSLVATGKNIDTHHVYVNFHIAYAKFHAYVNTASTSFFHVAYVVFLRDVRRVTRINYVNYVTFTTLREAGNQLYSEPTLVDD